MSLCCEFRFHLITASALHIQGQLDMSIDLVLRAVGALGLAAVAVSAQAAAVMPNFAEVPTGWTTDRYDPASFANGGTYQGRNNVLGIGITAAGDAANRGGQSGSFTLLSSVNRSPRRPASVWIWLARPIFAPR